MADQQNDMTDEKAVAAPALDARASAVRCEWRYAPLFVMLPLFSCLYYFITTLPGRSTLAHDEMWGALSFFDAIEFTLRFDVHPPLYYAQLNLWALAGHSDMWLQANSVAWLLGTATLAFYLVRKKSDGLSATIAAALILSSPMLIGYSVLVRMYTFLSFLTLAGLMASENILESISDRSVVRPRQWLVLLLVQIAVIYSYATGVIIVVANFLYTLLEAWNLRAPRRFFVRWAAMNIALGLLALPVIANSFIRQVGHAASPGFEDVLSSLTQLTVGTSLYGIGIRGVLLFVILLSLFGGAATLVRALAQPHCVVLCLSDSICGHCKSCFKANVAYSLLSVLCSSCDGCCRAFRRHVIQTLSPHCRDAIQVRCRNYCGCHGYSGKHHGHSQCRP